MRVIPPRTLAMAASVGPQNARAMRFGLLTDAEGSWPFVRRVARQSECLRLRNERNEPSGGGLELRDGCALVFGGDAGDKGGETLRCAAEC